MGTSLDDAPTLRGYYTKSLSPRQGSRCTYLRAPRPRPASPVGFCPATQIEPSVLHPDVSLGLVSGANHSHPHVFFALVRIGIPIIPGG